jgi:hypothetical protein
VSSRAERRAIAAIVTFAVAVALFTGFRMPNTWSMTLQSISLFHGFHRRFLVGTVLHPLLRVTDFDERLLASFSFLVLAALIVILWRSALRTQLWSRRLLIVAWFLLPTGGFLFNEVGYFDQVVYLMLFAGLFLVARGNEIAASCVMALTPCVHELAILTVVPIFGVYLLRRVSFGRAITLVAPAAAVAAIVLLVSPYGGHAIENVEAAFDRSNFKYRVDALDVFIRTQQESWDMYSIKQQFSCVVVPAVMASLAFVALWFADRGLWSEGSRPRRAIVLVASCVAIVSPLLLVFGGWDDNRWVFLVITNFFVIVWISLEDRVHEIAPIGIAILAVVTLVFSTFGLWYFDRLNPRHLTPHELRSFEHAVIYGRVFTFE